PHTPRAPHHSPTRRASDLGPGDNIILQAGSQGNVLSFAGMTTGVAVNLSLTSPQPLGTLGDTLTLRQQGSVAQVPNGLPYTPVRSEEHTLNSSHEWLSYAV